MKKLFQCISKIFRFIFATLNFLRLAIVNLLFIALIVAVYIGFNQTDGLVAPPIFEPSALVLKLSGPIVEQTSPLTPFDSFSSSLSGSQAPKEYRLFDIVDTIRYAAKDDNITGLVLSLKQTPETNLTKLRYIAKAINEFKATGKKVFATGDFYNQSQYYLASYADQVLMSPDGGVLLKGYSNYQLYYKTMLEKLDISTHVFRVGTYKSAVEPFLRDDMSPEAKQANTQWLAQMWGAYVEDVATNRQLDQAVFNPSMQDLLKQYEQAKGDLAQLAHNLGLVDTLANREQRLAILIDAFGSNDKNSFNRVNYSTYQQQVPSSYRSDADDIAVVVASGAIMNGTQAKGTVGGDTTSALLRQARLDDQVKAVVLRVDSPGGSAFASEVIRNEVEALQAAGKPVVVSMSSLAASGGYWISANASQIIAQPTTLTGSIGIFSVLTTVEKGINSLGIHADGIGTSPLSGTGFMTGISDDAKQLIQMNIEHGYQRFINLVSEGRNIDLEKIDKLAQGHVWTGSDAKKLGLVDRIGDFDDAVQVAAELADLEEYNLYWVREPLSSMEEFLIRLSEKAQLAIGVDMSHYLPAQWLPVLQQVNNDFGLLQQFNDPKGIYSLCLSCQVDAPLLHH